MLSLTSTVTVPILSLAAIGLASAQGIVENADAAAQYLASATPIQGTYRVISKADQKAFMYSWFGQNEIQLVDAATTPGNLIQQLASSIEHAIAADVWTFTPNNGTNGTTSMCIETACRCLAAQWDFGEAPSSTPGGGFDHFAVASPAVVGQVGGLECLDPLTGMTPDKQKWVWIKVDNSTGTPTVATTPSKRDLITPNSDEEDLELDDLLFRPSSPGDIQRVVQKSLEEQQQVKKDTVVVWETVPDFSGDYVVLAYDHLLNMTTKALTSQQLLSYDSLNSAALADFDPSNLVVMTLELAQLP